MSNSIFQDICEFHRKIDNNKAFIARKGFKIMTENPEVRLHVLPYK